jgi:hypothetical protein
MHHLFALHKHYIGHGTKLRDDDRGEEADGYDEALCPRDFGELCLYYLYGD